MTTDRELLEAAAKAAGIVGNYFDDDDLGTGIFCNDENDCGFTWNPLTDDGDALRLAVKLGLRFCANGNGGEVSIVGHTNDCHSAVVEENGDDPCAATRRAIVRAAAAIGGAL